MFGKKKITISKEIERRVHVFQSSNGLYPETTAPSLWREFGEKLADGGSRNFQVTNTQVGYLFFTPKNSSNILKETILTLKKLTNKSIGEFKNLSEVFQTNPDTALKEGIRKGILELFLLEINIRLQVLYKLYLSICNSAEKETHQHIVSVLATNLEEPVYEFLRAYDLPYMLGWLGYESDGKELDSFLQHLSNSFFKLNSVILRFTYHCNIKCRHCYNNSGADLKKERIPLGQMLQIIEQMPSVHINELTITGGEPFLYIPDILSLVSHARRYGISQVSIFTNASWATTKEHTCKILSMLKDSGFGTYNDYIKVSAGIYHQEHVPIERVFSLAEIYYSMFKKRLIIDFEHHAEDDEEKKIIGQLSEKNLSQKVRIQFRNIKPLGRGKTLPNVSKNAGIKAPCSSIKRIVFDPDGRVRPCCGLNAENDGIVVGRVDEDLRVLTKSIQNNPILQFISAHPIDAIFPYTNQNADVYSSPCEICQKALGKLKDTEPLKLRLTPFQEYYPFWFKVEKIPGLHDCKKHNTGHWEGRT